MSEPAEPLKPAIAPAPVKKPVAVASGEGRRAWQGAKPIPALITFLLGIVLYFGLPAVARAQEQYDLGRLDWPQIDASGTPEQTLAAVKAALS